MEQIRSLEDLLHHCIVRLDVGGRTKGTGFFAAPGVILTCAHVVEDSTGERTTQPVGIHWSGQDHPAHIQKFLPAPYPDLALLHAENLSEHPCVYLDGDVQLDDKLYSYGYPEGYPNGDPAYFEYEGLSRNPDFLKLKNAQARPGLSGAPLLNRRTGAVCGIAKKTRDRRIDLGGYAVPVSTILSVLDELVALQQEFHQRNTTWTNLVRQQHTRLQDEWLEDQLQRMQGALADHMNPPRPGSAPPLPSLFIGREKALNDLKVRLGITTRGDPSPSLQVLTAVRGWPGVGKTTLAAALAHDPDVEIAFPDGVLWASLGQPPRLRQELDAWGRALGIDGLVHADTVEEASARLAALLRDKRMLLIVDDVWEPEHAIPFRVGGRGCAMLFTTRLSSVAQALAPTDSDIYKLVVLTDKKALELLRKLAPTVVQHPEESQELVRELEGLPLALQVAGRLLKTEESYGLGVTGLLTELREGAKLLEAKAPADRTDLANETTPTVAALLQKSTERLDASDRERFSYLGAFAPKPATFDLAAMQAVWEVPDPKPTARSLVDRGLLEPVGSGRFQMHALLVLHAKSLLEG